MALAPSQRTMKPAVALDADDGDLIRVHADPSGLAFDRAANCLYVADTGGGGILRITDGSVERLSVDVASIVTATELSGIAHAPDATLYVTRIDYGALGGVYQIDPDGRSGELGGLDARWSRTALAYDATVHGLYVTRHLRERLGAGYGEVTRIDLATGLEETIAVGFLRPTGIAVLGDTLVVADQRLREVYRVELVDGQATYCTALATPIGCPDSVCAVDRDSVLVTAYDEKLKFGSIRRLWLDGQARTIACGSWQPRGVTTDGERAYVSIRHGRRVMVVPIPPC